MTEIRIVRGAPTQEEIAAAAAVLAALSAAARSVGARQESAVAPGWVSPAHHVPAGAWRAVSH